MPRVDTYFHLIRFSDSVVGAYKSANELNGGNSWLRHTAQKIHKISRRRRRSYYFLSPRKDVDLRGTLLEQVVVVVVKITSLLFTLRPSRQQIHKMSYLPFGRTIIAYFGYCLKRLLLISASLERFLVDIVVVVVVVLRQRYGKGMEKSISSLSSNDSPPMSYGCPIVVAKKPRLILTE